jgi:hypothetical protein
MRRGLIVAVTTAHYRDLPITSYAWQIKTTTGGPNAWWEANGSGPSSSNPWIGNHAGPQFGACPYGWPISAQQQGLLQSIDDGDHHPRFIA